MMTFEERIERLERTNRRYRLMFTLIGVLAVCAVGIGAAQDDGVPEVIRAKVFEVVDDEGNVLVRLTDGEGAGAVMIIDKTGGTLIGMVGALVDGKRAGQLFTFRDDKLLVTLTANKFGCGAINTYNTQGKSIVSLASTENGCGAISTFDVQGKKLVHIGILENDTGGFLGVYNKTAGSVCTLRVDEYGNGEVGAWDRNGNGRTLKPGP